MTVIVVGGGGREHALCRALAQNTDIEQVVCVPGNGGTAYETKCRNGQVLPGESTDDAAVRIARSARCDFAVIGPEVPLAQGLADRLTAAGIPSVGPGKQGAALEAGKDFAKQFMVKHGIACAASTTFTESRAACEYVKNSKLPIVIKADGLAAGKGVVIAEDVKTAHDTIIAFMDEGILDGKGFRSNGRII
jgi:phosphoribosylamine--glycine ligase